MGGRSPVKDVRAAWEVASPSSDEGLGSFNEESTSQLSRFFASLKNHASIEVRSDAVLADLADSASRSLHQTSLRHQPCAQDLLEGLSHSDRQETLIWLVQAYDVMHFQDGLLFDTALLLDRYYACRPDEDSRIGSSQRKLLAAVCMALKTGAPWDVQLSLRQVVKHLGRDQVPFDEVLAAELAMLSKLRFDVGTPTAHNFLEALSTRLTMSLRMTEVCKSLAEFLLQLTMGDAHVHYRFPHAVLAAAVLVLALCATRAPVTAHVALQQDLALYCHEAAQPNGTLAQCVIAVHMLWLRSTTLQEQSQFAFHVCQKFSRLAHHAVSSITPPLMPPSNYMPVQPLRSLTARSAQQDDLDAAVCVVHQSISEDSDEAESRDPQLWAGALAVRLRSIADASWRVRSILVRHGWAAGRFRRPPGREQLLRDLLRAAKGKEKPSEKVSNKENKEPPRTPSNLQDAAARRRSSSWCGQRSVGRPICTSSP